MRGHVHKRGDRWAYVVDVGRHPTTGARRQRSKTGFATRRGAEEALARLVAGIDPLVTVGAMNLDEFCRQWLNGHCPTVKATTAKGYRERLEWYVLPRLGHERAIIKAVLAKITVGPATGVRNRFNPERIKFVWRA